MRNLKIILIGFILATVAATSSALNFTIHNKKAKEIYNSLTGPQVLQEGAAGHLYRTGKSVLCRYTNVDITKNGKSVPKYAPCRYECALKFNHNGLAKPGAI